MDNYLLVNGIKYPVFFVDAPRAIAQKRNGEQVDVPVFKIPGIRWQVAVDITKPDGRDSLVVTDVKGMIAVGRLDKTITTDETT